MTIDQIRHYIQDQITNDPDTPIEADEELLLTGRLDSLGVMRLVAFLEAEGGFEIPPEDVVIEHFGSLAQIDRYLQSRREAPDVTSPNAG